MDSLKKDRFTGMVKSWRESQWTSFFQNNANIDWKIFLAFWQYVWLIKLIRDKDLSILAFNDCELLVIISKEVSYLHASLKRQWTGSICWCLNEKNIGQGQRHRSSGTSGSSTVFWSREVHIKGWAAELAAAVNYSSDQMISAMLTPITRSEVTP